MKSVKSALQLIAADGWTPPWNADSQGWCIHDALLEGCGFCPTEKDFDDYIEALNLLSEEAGEVVLDWERSPYRTGDQVIELFERVIG